MMKINSNEDCNSDLKIVHASITHSPNDDRILYREALSLKKRYKNIIIIGIGEEAETKYYKGIKLITVVKGNVIKMNQVIKKIIRSKTPDILHIHDPFLLPIANKFRKSGVKIIYDVHENHYLTYKLFSNRGKFIKNIIASIIRFTEKYYSKKSDSIITVTPNLYRNFLEINENTYEIRNYPNEDIFDDEKSDKLIDEIKKFKGNDLLMIYIGQISIKRNLELAVLTTKKLRERKYKIKFLAIGTGEQDDVLFYKILADKYKEFFKIMPIIPHHKVHQVLKNSDIGWSVLPYTDNFLFAFPNKIFEYMSVGIPFISSRLKYVKKIVDETKSGIIVDELYIDDIVNTVDDFIENKHKFVMFGKNGRKYFESKYNWKTQESELFDVYKLVNK